MKEARMNRLAGVVRFFCDPLSGWSELLSEFWCFERPPTDD